MDCWKFTIHCIHIWILCTINRFLLNDMFLCVMVFFASKRKKALSFGILWHFLCSLLNFYITRLFCTFFFNALNKCGVCRHTRRTYFYHKYTLCTHEISSHTPVYYAPVYPKWSPPLKRIIVAFYGHTCNSHIIATVKTTH